MFVSVPSFSDAAAAGKKKTSVLIVFGSGASGPLYQKQAVSISNQSRTTSQSSSRSPLRASGAFGAPPAGVRRQDLPASFRPNGAVYIDGVEFLRRERNFVVEGVTVGVPMPAERSVDVDDALDLAVAEALLAGVKAE